VKELTAKPIGFARSPFKEKADAPRQAPLASGTKGSIEILPEFRDGLSDLDGFERIWILFWFDRAVGWHSKVLPPRSEEKRGVFATRSPHRPNPIGMSAVRLERVDFEAGILHILDLDLIDGTPVLDIKPYIPYADAFPDANAGWLDASDPQKAWAVAFEPLAEEMLEWIASNVRERIVTSLTLGPQPHAYRRIKTREDGKRILAVKEWRVCFRVDSEAENERRIVVESVATGYRRRDLEEGSEPVHELHRAFVGRFAPTT
jgi:tRNA-Thr(GGU) m(6)t(6)A37 methyltransferase TsaA